MMENAKKRLNYNHDTVDSSENYTNKENCCISSMTKNNARGEKGESQLVNDFVLCIAVGCQMKIQPMSPTNFEALIFRNLHFGDFVYHLAIIQP